MTDLLVCQDVCKQYQEGPLAVKVLESVSFTIQKAQQVAILGSSGSGKSTLLHILGALDAPTSGKVFYKGQDIFAFDDNQQASFRNKSLGFVYQFHHLLPEFTAIENVAMPLMIGGTGKKQALTAAAEMMDKVALSHRLEHRPAELSGGERQRVAIARALINKPDLVLADEPTGNLDQKTGEGIFQLLMDLKQQFDTSFIVVTHDIELANRLDRVLTINDGHLTEKSE